MHNMMNDKEQLPADQLRAIDALLQAFGRPDLMEKLGLKEEGSEEPEQDESMEEACPECEANPGMDHSKHQKKGIAIMIGIGKPVKK